MKSTVKKSKDCKVKLLVEVESEVVERRYQEVLRDFQKTAQIPGFREGRAPMELVEKRYFKEAEEELLKALVPEAYHRSVAAQKLSPVSLPSISDMKFEKGKKLTFAADFEEAPDFNLKNYKGIKIKKAPVDVQADEVEKGLQSLVESKAELVPLVEPRAIEKGDFIEADIEIWEEGKYVPGKKGMLLSVEPNHSDDFYDKVIGAGLDEVKEVLVDPTEEEKKGGLVGRKPLYKVWIRGIRSKKLPSADDEFAKGFGKESLADLKEAVRKDIAGHKNTQSFQKMKAELFERLLEITSFTLPEGLVQKQKERLVNDAEREFEKRGYSREQFGNERHKVEADADKKAREQLKLYFILQKVAESEGIMVEEEALDKRLGALSEEAGRSLEEVRRVFEEDVRESMKEAKTIDFLLANAKLEEKE